MYYFKSYFTYLLFGGLFILLALIALAKKRSPLYILCLLGTVFFAHEIVTYCYFPFPVDALGVESLQIHMPGPSIWDCYQWIPFGPEMPEHIYMPNQPAHPGRNIFWLYGLAFGIFMPLLIKKLRPLKSALIASLAAPIGLFLFYFVLYAIFRAQVYMVDVTMIPLLFIGNMAGYGVFRLLQKWGSPVVKNVDATWRTAPVEGTL